MAFPAPPAVGFICSQGQLIRRKASSPSLRSHPKPLLILLETTMSVNPDVRFTLGAVLGGGFLSAALSGTLCIQAFLYFRCYPKDPIHLKTLVALVWAMDTAQTCCIVMLSYQYMILNFSRPEMADHIFWTVVAAIIFTAVSTFTVNGYSAHRVHKLSQGNWWLTAPTVLCLATRLTLAIITGLEMLRLQSFLLYRQQLGPLLTTGLALSAFTDVIITAGLCHYLRTLDQGLNQTKKMLSMIVSFADNNGALTCLVALASLICWVVMPTKLIYLGLHFTIGKCYSNSLLATLNMRHYVKSTAIATPEIVNVMGPGPPSWRSSTSFPMVDRPRGQWSDFEICDVPGIGAAGQLEIKVDKTVHYD
ncbi:hypothetical protein H4582DRAFT_831102 [Lactarius indigo]|nr:hypothetical protein H4582DRAFT_831102 [Lactarius indigo]